MLEAKEVYVVMQNNYRISRNIRAKWFFKNLNKTLTFKWKTCQVCVNIYLLLFITMSSNFKIKPLKLKYYEFVFCFLYNYIFLHYLFLINTIDY